MSPAVLASVPGLVALKEVTTTTRVDARTFGFRWGPRLNAGGRLEDASHPVALLLSDSLTAARPLAEACHRINQERVDLQREVEEAAHRDALERLALDPPDPVLVLCREGVAPRRGRDRGRPPEGAVPAPRRRLRWPGRDLEGLGQEPRGVRPGRGGAPGLRRGDPPRRRRARPRRGAAVRTGAARGGAGLVRGVLPERPVTVRACRTRSSGRPANWELADSPRRSRGLVRTSSSASNLSAPAIPLPNVLLEKGGRWAGGPVPKTRRRDGVDLGGLGRVPVERAGVALRRLARSRPGGGGLDAGLDLRPGRWRRIGATRWTGGAGGRRCTSIGGWWIASRPGAGRGSPSAPSNPPRRSRRNGPRPSIPGGSLLPRDQPVPLSPMRHRPLPSGSRTPARSKAGRR